MRVPLFQVDAFAERAFAGNPAAVCPLPHWLDDGLLQAIAAENNLAETAFFVPSPEGFDLRWFTPATEVDLCGHATLASAHVLFAHLGCTAAVIAFSTRSGVLHVRRDGERLQLNFPALPAVACPPPAALVAGLGAQPDSVLAAADYLAVFADEEAVRGLTPDFSSLAHLDRRGVIVTAPGHDVDFVSRFFAPKLGVPEDPVTGSAHCTLAAYWAARLRKNRLTARQVSRRGGRIDCELAGDRVRLTGSAVTVVAGEFIVPD